MAVTVNRDTAVSFRDLLNLKLFYRQSKKRTLLPVAQLNIHFLYVI